ncbi:MAG TPA: type II toxin-antitoxin system prevent-host-death family antitoxin [Acidimicrobiales bacterium]|nr:type II toxin-antitoxin system prevent-host-death family antitoxin [Acidimicrobiales bacterium]
MTEISATDAARKFADLLDAVEHRGERITIVRRGRAIALIEPIPSGRGSDVKAMLRRHKVDSSWRTELAGLRDLLTIEERS